MTVRVGIIGMGFMGRMHLAGYQKLPGVKVVAIADIDQDTREGRAAGAGNLGDTEFSFNVKSFDAVYDCGFKLIGDPNVDLVDICVPTCDHAKLFVAAADAGKHVLSEKPIAVQPDDIAAIVAAGKRAKGAVMIAQCIRFWPAYVLLKEYVTSGKLGKCKSLILCRQGGRGLWSPWYYKAAISGGAIYDLHVHDTDYVNHLFGKPEAVSSIASVGGTTDRGVDHVVTNYHYPSEVVDAVTAIGAWHQHKKWPFFMGYTAVFEGGTLDFNIQRPQPVMLYTDDTAEEIKVPETDGWFEELRYFTGVIARGEQPTCNPIASTEITMKIVQAEERSIQSGTTAKVN